MLPPFIIEQIRRREEERRRKEDDARPRAEVPLDIYHPAPEPKPEDPARDRGVVILDLG